MSRRTASVAWVSAAMSLVCVAGLAVPARSVLAAPQSTPAAAENVLTGTIDAVTVYRGQAQVARLIDVPGGAGLREVVVTNLPEAIVPSSLYAESADGAEIRSVSYRVRPIGEDSRESVRAAEKAVRDARDAFDAARSQEDYHKWQRAYLDKLENFVAPAAQVELKSGVLNADTLTKLTELVTTKRKSQTEEWQKLTLEIRSLTETLQLRERELAVLTVSTSRTAREAVVFVNATKAGAKLRLSYLVSGANWTPSYNLRIPDAKAEKARLEYQASVQQMSGEDWANVQLTLSTATPALVATGPALQPLTVALAAPSGKEVALSMLKDKGYDQAKRELAAQLQEVEKNRNMNGNDQFWAYRGAQTDMGRRGSGAPAGGAGEKSDSTLATGLGYANAGIAADGRNDRESFGTVLSLDAGLNDLADRSQLLDLISNTKVERKTKTDQIAVRQGDEGVSVTYKVSGRTSMPSRADQQLIQIAQMELPVQVVRVATPTLSQFVYNEAHLTNAGDTVLLAGPAASYIGGEFVGSGGVPTVAAGESFRAGFGIDSSLRTSKELVERSDSTQGGNRIIEFTYKLTVENFGKSPASVRLLDRLPSTKDSEIKLTPVDPKPALSEDKEYRDTDYKKNILRWDLTVPAGATGTKALTVEYKFKLEYDRQKTLTEGK